MGTSEIFYPSKKKEKKNLVVYKFSTEVPRGHFRNFLYHKMSFVAYKISHGILYKT